MADTLDFLLEIGTEEMPSSPLEHAIVELADLCGQGLDRAGLAHGQLRTLSTPRRLTVIAEDVATATKELHEVKRGPAARIAYDAGGAPTKAALGFARKNHIDVRDLIKDKDTDGKEYVFAKRSVAARAAMPLLSKLCEEVIAGLGWPNYRSQRWGSEHVTFVRPIRWICALFGSDVIPVSYGDVVSGATTRGHRVLGPGEHRVYEPREYQRVLKDAFVLDQASRDQLIRAGIAELEAARKGAHVDTPKDIYQEVLNLCEWPSVLVGVFDEDFLRVPHEIICDTMLKNQRYFPIYDNAGQLTREFVIVANGDPRYASNFISGNERVVRARLDDAKFFYDEDLKVPLDEFVERLSEVVFQEKLGTMRQKVARMELIAADVARQAGAKTDIVEHATRAAHLAKADLVSHSVIEFTSQQGVMGSYYAAHSGEPEDVVRAVREHYQPRFAGDVLPEGLVGKSVALSDKLDTICGMFAVGEAPTGSADPFAVRRCAIGVIAILRTLPAVSLPRLIDVALDGLKGQKIIFDMQQVRGEITRFFSGRLASIARKDGISPDIVMAVSAVGIIDPAEFFARVQALEKARNLAPELFFDLATAYRRAAHLADSALGCDVDETVLGEAERALLDACGKGERDVEMALAARDYDRACACLAELRAPIDRFFDDVLVMDKDLAIRKNRLRLLNRFAATFAGVADIGALSRKK